MGSFLVGNYDLIGKISETQFEGGDTVRDDEGLRSCRWERKTRILRAAYETSMRAQIGK